jgi:hypothetical protein
VGGVTALFATEAIKPASRGLFHSCPSGTAGSQHSKGDTKGYVTVTCGTAPPAICLNIQFCCDQEGGDETA